MPEKDLLSTRLLNRSNIKDVILVIISVDEYPIETNAAENRRKKRYQGFVISCQISITNFDTFVPIPINPSSKK